MRNGEEIAKHSSSIVYRAGIEANFEKDTILQKKKEKYVSNT